MPRNLYAQIVLNTEAHGPLDIEFKIEKFGDIDTLLDNGFSIEALKSVSVIPEGLALSDMAPNATLESLARRLEVVDDLKSDTLEGADRYLKRSSQVEQLAEKQTSAQPEQQSIPRPGEDHESFERRVSDWVGLLLGHVSRPLLGAGLPSAG